MWKLSTEKYFAEKKKYIPYQRSSVDDTSLSRRSTSNQNIPQPNTKIKKSQEKKQTEDVGSFDEDFDDIVLNSFFEDVIKDIDSRKEANF